MLLSFLKLHGLRFGAHKLKLTKQTWQFLGPFARPCRPVCYKNIFI